MGTVLLAALVLPLASYFWAAYRTDDATLPLRERMLTAHDDLLAIHLDDRRTGWIVGAFGLILHTQDGGRTWRHRANSTTKTLTAVSFADDRHGFAVGNGGTIVATGNGGRTWEKQLSGVQEHLLGLHVSSQREAHVVGAFGTILSTGDGGSTWNKHKLPWEKLIPRVVEDIGLLEPNLNAVHFVTRKVGWAVGEFGLVLRTADRGQTWVSQRHGLDSPQLADIVFQDQRRGFAVGQKGTFIKTLDGGKQWFPVNVGTQQNLNKIFMDGNRGVVVGNGVVLTTKNGGANWEPVDTFPNNLWLSGVAANGKTAVAVGQSGYIGTLDIQN
jgi:photosystem II stability/assembly factor-like uncharacterized protein